MYYLDPAPLVEQLRLFAAEQLPEQVTRPNRYDGKQLSPTTEWRQLALLYATRYGVPQEHPLRQLHRMRRAQQITPLTADRWACLIGLHPANVYPELYEEVA